MARIKKKGQSGTATSYMSRKAAMNKLQLSLKDFRRLCILKGIYPVQPHHKKKANKNNSSNKTYYFAKDIKFIAHEPVINYFRSMKIFMKRLSKAIGKQDQESSRRIKECPPVLNIDHIVKERYPTFIDAVRDIDDAISMCFLFSTFPKDKHLRPELIQLCRRLSLEFLHYIVETKSLRKVFVSIKGIYYQAEIMGQPITWVVPHSLGFSRPTEVDFKIMVTFVQFYSTMLGFVNYKLYNSMNLIYPPKLSVSHENTEEVLKGEDDMFEYIAALNLSLKLNLDKAIEEEEVLPDDFPELGGESDRKTNEEKLKKLQNLFVGCKIYLNREVPKESLLFVIRSFGGEVSFDKSLYVGATFEESDPTITHQIIDRPLGEKQYLNRYYVQPQWVYDSVNAGMLLPLDLYFPGEILPPHLSPFVEEKEGDYVPPEKLALLDYQKGLTQTLRRKEESSHDESSSESVQSDEDEVKPKKRKNKNNEDGESKKVKMSVTAGVPQKFDTEEHKRRTANEEKRLAFMVMSKKDKRLYKKIIFGQKRKNTEVRVMKEKRENYEKQRSKSVKRQKNKT